MATEADCRRAVLPLPAHENGHAAVRLKACRAVLPNVGLGRLGSFWLVRCLDLASAGCLSSLVGGVYKCHTAMASMSPAPVDSGFGHAKPPLGHPIWSVLVGHYTVLGVRIRMCASPRAHVNYASHMSTSNAAGVDIRNPLKRTLCRAFLSGRRNA